VQHSPERRLLNLELRDYLYRNLYYHTSLRWLNRRSLKMLEQLFRYYLAHPKDIGAGARRRVQKTGLHRAVCDYLAGMTDRYVGLEYQRIFGGTNRV
jgi:dGTPase